MLKFPGFLDNSPNLYGIMSRDRHYVDQQRSLHARVQTPLGGGVLMKVSLLKKSW